MNKLTKIAAASVVAMGMGIAGNAHAHAYAYSTNDITSFGITGILGFTNPVTTSTSAATLTGFIGVANSHFMDTPQSLLGAPNPGENFFGQQGHVGEYARGDAQIRNADVLNGNGSAVNVAESWIVSGLPFPGFQGTGNGTNELSAAFNLANAGTVGFSFFSDAHMETMLGTHADPGSKAQANLAFSIAIQDALGAIIFNWAPDGVVSGVGEVDPFSLNLGISSILPNGITTHYHPIAGTFSNSIALGAGDYTLNVRQVENVSTTHVPEPGSIFLLGVGLMGLVYGRRKMAHRV